MRHPQRALPFASASPTLERFLVGGNGELVTRLRQLSAQTFVVLWLYSDDCLGKTHLLRAVAAAGGRYLPGRSARLRHPIVSPAPLLALDDVEQWLGDEAREAALMALYQSQFSAHRPLLLSSRRSPQILLPQLADLASRLRAAETFELVPPRESERRIILERLAARRSLSLPPEVLDYWLLRGERSLRALTEGLELVIDFALGAQRPITVPLVKEALGW